MEIKPSPWQGLYRLLSDDEGFIWWGNFDPSDKKQIWRLLVAHFESQASLYHDLTQRIDRIEELIRAMK